MATSGLLAEREAIRPLLSLSDPADAAAAYYALHHPPALTQLCVHRDDAGSVNGFLAACITGADLFRPLVVMRAESNGTLRALLHQGLVGGRPYHFVIPLRYVALLEREVELTEERVGAILALDPLRFQPVVNVLVVPAEGASGGLRFEIRSQGRVMAAAGTNWRSPGSAEVYVYTEPEARGRGWGRSVVSALTVALLAEGVRPLYVVEEGDQTSRTLATALGYYDSGAREFSASGVRKP